MMLKALHLWAEPRVDQAMELSQLFDSAWCHLQQYISRIKIVCCRLVSFRVISRVWNQVCPWLCIVFVCIVCVYDVKHTHVLFNRPWGISLTLIVSIFTVSVVHYTFISTLFSCNRQLNPWNDKYDCGCILKSGMDCLLESHRVVTGTCIPIDYWLLLCHVSDLQQNVSSVTRYWSIHSPPHWPVSTRLSSTACMHLRI